MGLWCSSSIVLSYCPGSYQDHHLRGRDGAINVIPIGQMDLKRAMIFISNSTCAKAVVIQQIQVRLSSGFHQFEIKGDPRIRRTAGATNADGDGLAS